MSESLDRLWAGWRSAYLAGEVEDVAADADCVLCAVIDAATATGRHLVAATEHAVVVLNAFPYTSGHVLVLPRRHEHAVDGLGDREHIERGRLGELGGMASRFYQGYLGFGT